MTKYTVAYGAALVAMAVIDGVWLGFVARDFYRTQLGSLMADKPVWPPAALFYLLYPAGLVFFVVAPTLRENSLLAAALAGAFFGLVAYGTYDLSNVATLRNWPSTLTYVDLAWGTVLTAAVSSIAWIVASRIG
jgi:uncharacterized membrane protein